MSGENDLDRTSGVGPANLEELLASGIIRKAEGAKFRDTSIIILRHADELEDRDARTLGISDVGKNQIKSSVEEIAVALGKVEGGVIIKFYSSPQEQAKDTARGMIEEIENRMKSNSWPQNTHLLSIPGIKQEPKERERLTREVQIDRSDVASILAERESRRSAGDNVEFSTILIERDRRGELRPGTEGRESVVRRLAEAVRNLQRINERIPAKGEKLLLILITHNIYFEALLGRGAEGCRGVRIDLPLKDGDKPILVGADSSKKLDW